MKLLIEYSFKMFRGCTMPRSLARSNAHFKKALNRLPLGVASNFRFSTAAV
jgi:hypothetical protein